MATEASTSAGARARHARARDELGAWGFAVLWGDLGIGLLVLLAGSFLVPALSLPQALGAIVVGSVIGVTLLGLTGIVGSQTGLPTMVCLRPALGLARLVRRDRVQRRPASRVDGVRAGDHGPRGQRHGPDPHGIRRGVGVDPGVRRRRDRARPLGAGRRGAGVADEVRALGRAPDDRLADVAPRSGALDLGALWTAPAAGGLSFWAAVDIVIAMPISWLPLVCDYSRFARRPAPGLLGDHAGIPGRQRLVLHARRPDPPRHGDEPGAEGVRRGDRAPGRAARSCSCCSADETDEAWADLYSCAVSIQNALPRVSARPLVGALGARGDRPGARLRRDPLRGLPAPDRCRVRAALRGAGGRLLRGPAGPLRSRRRRSSAATGAGRGRCRRPLAGRARLGAGRRRLSLDRGPARADRAGGPARRSVRRCPSLGAGRHGLSRRDARASPPRGADAGIARRPSARFRLG